MKKYFLYNGTEQQGPFDLEELKSKWVTKDTPVWCDGLTDWVAAGELEELSGVLRTAAPPPFPAAKAKSLTASNAEIGIPEKKRSSGKVGLVLILLIVVAAMALWILSNQSTYSGTLTVATPQTYDEKAMTVEETERADPARFLITSGTYNPNFWGNVMRIHGVIENKATIAKYKDVVLEVSLLSDTDTELGTQRFTVYDYFPPHSINTFELKVSKPVECKKMSWKAISATPVNGN